MIDLVIVSVCGFFCGVIVGPMITPSVKTMKDDLAAAEKRIVELEKSIASKVKKATSKK